MAEQIQKQRQRSREVEQLHDDAYDVERQARAAEIVDRLAKLSTQVATTCDLIDELLGEVV